MEISLTKEVIKERLNRKGLSYAAFAEAIGVKRQNLDACLDAQKKDINMVMRMAEALDMSLNEFLGIPEPGEKEVYGCLYVHGQPRLVNSKEEIRNLLNSLDS